MTSGRAINRPRREKISQKGFSRRMIPEEKTPGIRKVQCGGSPRKNSREAMNGP